MKIKPIKFIVITILISLSFLVVKAQKDTISVISDVSTEKAESKKEPAKKQSSDDNSWTGFYVGGFGGYTNGRASADTSTVLVANALWGPVTNASINGLGGQRIKANGFNGGGTVGYNFQKRNFVVGAELDFGANRINKSVKGSLDILGGSHSITVAQSVKSDWVLTARHRVGVATKKVLLYATGGLAVTNIKYDGSFNMTFGEVTESGSLSKSKAGWTAGGGLEVKATKRWSVKGEYLFNQFGRTSITSNNLAEHWTGTAVPFPQHVFTHSTDLKTHNIRFGINYRF